MGVFRVKHGGNIRFSAKVASSETINWNKGRILAIDTSGDWIVYAGTTLRTVGTAMENRVTSSTGPTTTVTKTGAPTGDRYSAILDDAVVLNDQIRSGITFAAGDEIFSDTSGQLTTSGNGTGPISPRLGWALGVGVAGDTTRPVEMFWHVEY